MKSFFIKIFMMVAAQLCLLEGLVLIAVGLGKLPPDKLQLFYANLITQPKVLSIIAGVGIFFVFLGFILLIMSSRTKPAPKMILVVKEGKTLTIPQATIRDFIRQIIEQDPYVSDFNIEFEDKGNNDMEIQIATALNGVSSIYQELDQIEEVLRSEIERVFEWKAFKLNFQIRGVGVDPQKKYFSSSDSEIQPEPLAEEEGTSEQLEKLIDSDEEKLLEQVRELPVAKRRPRGKDKPRSSSFLTKMLWGK